METTLDPLRLRPQPDRLHYAVGELLGADDLRDEQTYHRGQLARSLVHLYGSGTIAGLKVTLTPKPNANGPGQHEIEVAVEPGLALDRMGRLIEVPRRWCLRLRRWFEFLASQPASSTATDLKDLQESWRESAPAAPQGTVVADLFLGFHPCGRQPTPAFATGPFDALDATQPSRVRDGFELQLLLRRESDAALGTRAPHDPWRGVTAPTLRDFSYRAWAGALPPKFDQREAEAEYPTGADKSSVILARMRIPATRPASATAAPVVDWSGAGWPAPDDSVRRIVVPPAALRQLAGV